MPLIATGSSNPTLPQVRLRQGGSALQVVVWPGMLIPEPSWFNNAAADTAFFFVFLRLHRRLTGLNCIIGNLPRLHETCIA